jgi:branched-chain amino acid transport system permease protein
LVIGGIGTIAGPLVGTLILVGASELLQGAQQYRFLLFGPLLVVLVIFFPHGIAGGFNRLLAAFPRAERRAQSSAEAEAALP